MSDNAILAPLALAPVALDGLVQMFLQGRAPGTMLAYAKDLSDLSRHLGVPQDELPRTILSAGHGEANCLALKWRSAMLESGLAPASINRKLAALRSLVALARTIGAVPWTLEVKSVPSQSYRFTRGPGLSAIKEVVQGIAAKIDGPRKHRDAAMLRLMWDHALRRAEVVSLDLCNIELSSTPTVSIMGKGRRERETLTLSPTAATALSEWLRDRGPCPGPLFPSITVTGALGGRLTGRGLAYIAGKWGEAAGIKLKCHGVRHSSLTAALDEENGDIRKVAKFSRHRDERTVMLYDDNRQNFAGEIATKIGALL
jgi:integrase/recombinase XerC